MGITIVGLEPRHLPALVRFSQRTWQRPATLEFCRWRYLEAPSHQAYLALRGDECLAFVSVFTRPYRIAEDSATFLETADWHCLPELRLSGIGIRLMRRVMEGAAPIVAVGGSADTLGLLPRLGWQRVGQTTEFALGLGARALHTALAAGGLAQVGRALGAWLTNFVPYRGPAPPGCEALPVAGVGLEFQALYAGRLCCNTVPLPMVDQLAWLARGLSGARRLLAIDYRCEGATLGWSLLRLETHGDREAVLLELFAPTADLPMRAWMVAEAVRQAAAAGASRVRAQTSCPALESALRRNGFAERFRWPVHVSHARGSSTPGPHHFCLNTGDAALLPYPPGRPASSAGNAA